VKFYNKYLKDIYNRVHILPHFKSPVVKPHLSGPASRADGGFAVADFKMDPYYGTPEQLQSLEGNLMFDFVLNHLAVRGEWFKRFLEDDPEYKDYFITIPKKKLGKIEFT